MAAFLFFRFVLVSHSWFFIFSMSPDPSLSDTTLQRDTLSALRAWQQLDGAPENHLAYLLQVQEERAALPDANPANLRLATNRVLLTGIKVLESQDEMSAKILKLRFLDGHIVIKVGHTLGLTEDEVKKRQRKAINRLAQIILDRETAVRQERIQYWETELDPPTYTALFGTAENQAALTKQLLSAAAPVVVLSGIGGIGKTALANAVTRNVLRHFHFSHIIWLRVSSVTSPESGDLPATVTLGSLMHALAQRLCPFMPPETSPKQRNFQVRQALSGSPHLLIIDNLETKLDPDLLTHLHDMAQPSKFLLTSRTRPPQLSGVFNFVLSGLEVEDVAQLIRHHAREIGLVEITEAPNTTIQAIYDIIGGNPLALKLIVNLAGILPLSQILEDLHQAKLDQVESMYRHIYWQTWRTLSEEGRTLLKVLPLAADTGSTPEQLLAISSLSEKIFWGAISELTARSLLEVRGTTQSRRYGIHRLTESFLKTEIIHWPQDNTS